MWATLLSGHVFRGTLVNRKKTGELYHAEQPITPMRDDAGRTTHYVSVIKDLTERMAETMLSRNGFNVNPQNLVIVDGSSFGNNITAALALAAANPANATTIVTNVITAGVTDVAGIVNRLYAAGARNILVMNVPDVGKSPLLQASGNATAIATATTMSLQYNGAVAQQMNNVRAVSPGLSLGLFDLAALASQVQANPAAFGFANGTTPCFIPPTATTPASLCSPDVAIQNTYAFWDPFHPTAATHALMAQRAIGVIGK